MTVLDKISSLLIPPCSRSDHCSFLDLSLSHLHGCPAQEQFLTNSNMIQIGSLFIFKSYPWVIFTTVLNKISSLLIPKCSISDHSLLPPLVSESHDCSSEDQFLSDSNMFQIVSLFIFRSYLWIIFTAVLTRTVLYWFQRFPDRIVLHDQPVPGRHCDSVLRDQEERDGEDAARESALPEHQYSSFLH